MCCSVLQCVAVLRRYHCALSLMNTHMSPIIHTHAHMSTVCAQFCADVVSLQYTVAVTATHCCNVLPCVDVYCHVLPCVAVCCRVLPCVAVCCCVLPWCVVVCCRVLQCVAVCCRVLQFQHCVHAPLRARSDRQRVCHCNPLQHTATHCNTL